MNIKHKPPKTYIPAKFIAAALTVFLICLTGCEDNKASLDNTIGSTDLTEADNTASVESTTAAESEADTATLGSTECESKEGTSEIDFAALKNRCPDVYAWITIPGTNIDYPIAYCDAEEPFYWDHDIDSNPDEKGMIITDSLNSRDFSDPMTLIYGKNPEDGTMFSMLHEYRNEDFFDSHDKIVILTENDTLTYKVFAVYLYPNVQILQKYRFDDPLSFTEFFNSLEDVRDLSKNIKEDLMPDYEDYVITLVTHCDSEDKRLFVQAKLMEDGTK